MALLTLPAELLDLANGESREFRVLRWEEGGMVIRQRQAPAGKEVTAIRMHVPPEDKPAGAPYWDATAGNLVARLRVILDDVVASRRPIRVTKHGEAPVARHQVDFL